MVLCMTGSSATTMWGITELPACVIQQIQPCSTLIIDSYSFLRMPSIHCNLILNLSSDWFTSFNTIHNDQKCFYLMAVTTKISKMKAPGWRWRHLHMEGGRRIVLQWDRGCDIILFQPYTFSARTDVSTRASGLIIVPRRKGVCTCVSDCFRASLVSMPMSWTWFFCSVKFCLFGIWNHGAELCYENLSWFEYFGSSKTLTAASICHVYAQQTRVRMCVVYECNLKDQISQNKPQYVTVSQHFFFVFTVRQLRHVLHSSSSNLCFAYLRRALHWRCGASLAIAPQDLWNRWILPTCAAFCTTTFGIWTRSM